MFNNNNAWLFVEGIIHNKTGCSIQGLGGGGGLNEDKISIPISL